MNDLSPSSRHTMGNLVTAMESQLYLIESALRRDPSRVTEYLERMRETLEKMKKILPGFQDVSEATD